jgi:multidrug efflux pump subunit AcrB
VFSRFFIDRPIFASVLSIITILGGLLAYAYLPVAQYPEITPPTVEVSAVYPGANAQVVADTVAAPIEQQVNGVERMLYMSSQCTNDGSYKLTVTFENGVDLNIAQVLVQNRVTLAQPILPDLVQRRGVTVKKKSPNVLMIINLFSRNNRQEDLYLSNYATIQLKDELSRLKGVGDITYLGQRDYSMRVWLDPQKMAVRNLSTADVVQAINEQNTQVAAGQIGQPPVAHGQAVQLPMNTLGRLTDPEQFDDMILKAENGRFVRLKDVADSELGAQVYDQTCTMDGKPSVALSIYQLPGSNALEVARLVKDKMKELKDRFPEGLDYQIVYDTTPFIEESIGEVRKTLLDAVLLVSIVVLVFLQNWRSALIPMVAVPVAIVGTFAVMSAIGFSLNNLTLFGLVLAIGIVVDDAIVVVEAVEHHIEHGLSPREATIKAMQQVSGPVVAVGLVLSAVFVPCAFITGITGQFFRQFAITIAVSTLISAFNSLTLSPALTALLLRPTDKATAKPLPRIAFPLIGGILAWNYLTDWLEPWLIDLTGSLPPDTGKALLDSMDWAAPVTVAALGALVGWVVSRPLNYLLAWLFRGFNAGFNRATDGYTRAVGTLLRVSVVVLVVYGGLLGLTYFGFTESPKGFVPTQDKGYLLVNVQLPDSASLERTQKVMATIEKVALGDKKDRKHFPGIPGIKHTVAIAGQSILLGANAPNFGAVYVMLDEFEKRLEPGLSGDEIAARLQAALEGKVEEGLVHVFGAPPIEGLGTAGGFKIMLEDRGDIGEDELQQISDDVLYRGRQAEGLQDLFSSYRANTPWLFIDIDRTAVKTHGASMADVFNMLQVNLGSLYVNDFNRFGRTWQVNVQADPDYRDQVDKLQQMKVRNTQNRMVPFGSFGKVEAWHGPVMILRYNMYRSSAVNGNPVPGVSSGQAIAEMEQVAGKDLPRAMRAEWTELALLQLQTGNTAMWVFLLAVVLVFLVLAAQYESWSLPLAVILVVPMCLLCSVAGVLVAHLDINIFTQVGFVVLIGLACKNAILIVEFAKAQRESGVPRHEATLAAVKLRLRPIVMTSFAFILGVVPLVISEGAGAEMRRTLGTAVFAGMLGVTLFGIFLTPVFYNVIQWFSDWREQRREMPEELPGTEV